jgi:hypothetical protein
MLMGVLSMFMVKPLSWSLPNKVTVSFTLCAESEHNAHTSANNVAIFFMMNNILFDIIFFQRQK